MAAKSVSQNSIGAKLHILFSILLLQFATLGLAATAKLHRDEGTESKTSPISLLFLLKPPIRSSIALKLLVNWWSFDVWIVAVKALKEIEKKLGKNDWNFTLDPCSGEGNWRVDNGRKGFESSVTCDCSFNHNSTCHIVAMYDLILSLFLPLFSFDYLLRLSITKLNSFFFKKKWIIYITLDH